MTVPDPQLLVGDAVELALTDVAHGGKAVGRAHGRVVFVPFGITDERVEARLTRLRKKFAEAEITRIVQPSTDRVSPECPYFGTCGGCQFQHIAYSRQLELKRKVVSDTLERVGGFTGLPVHPTIASPLPYGYRNHTRFLVGPDGSLGYADWRENRFLRVDTCPIAHPEIDRALAGMQGRGRPGEHVRVRYSETTGECSIVAPSAPDSSDQPITLTYELLGHAFQVSPDSFFQANTRQAETLIRAVLEQLGAVEGKRVLDVYCGVGLYTRFIAERAGETVGIEESPSAVADALVNLAGLPAQVLEGGAERLLPELPGRFEGVVLNPPRTGCAPAVLRALLAKQPERIVYVSCDPATLARDLKTLCAPGRYAVTNVQPIDMFPQTYHIEAVVTLQALAANGPGASLRA